MCCTSVSASSSRSPRELGPESRVVDEAWVPEMQPAVHAGCVDNFLAFPQSNRGAGAPASRPSRPPCRERTRRRGGSGVVLRVGRAAHSCKAAALVAGSPCAAARGEAPNLVWTRGGCLGRTLHALPSSNEGVVVVLFRRVQVHTGGASAAASVGSDRRELRWAAALCCFCQRDEAMKVCTEVLACDAPEWGLGVVWGVRGEEVMRETMRYSEGSRFPEGEPSARAAVRGQIVRVVATSGPVESCSLPAPRGESQCVTSGTLGGPSDTQAEESASDWMPSGQRVHDPPTELDAQAVSADGP